MTVTRDTLTTSAWDSIYTYLQTTNALSTNNIFSAWNSTLATTKGYPLVIIYPPLTSMEKLNVTGDFIQSNISFLIEVYHTSAQTVKSLRDEVVAKLIDGRRTLAGLGLKRMQVESGTYDTWRDGKKKIHRYAFDVTFFFTQYGD